MADPTNSDIADALDELGDLYELDGAIIHRVVAYRTAAQSVRDASTSVAALAREGRATELAGVGKTLQEKILALVEHDEIPATVKLRAKFPAGLVQMTRLPGLGPKRARMLYEALGIDSLDALREAAEGERLRTLKGFGPKAEENILAALEATPDGEVERRVVLDRALAVGDPIVAALRAHPAAAKVELAGSARRMADSCKDLDIIATAKVDDATGKTLECTSEEAVYAALDLAYMEPELRENRGELEAAAGGGAGLPKLIAERDLRGDLHSHTTASDGKNSIEEMAMAAREAGYRYLAVTDHSASMGFGMDVPPKQLERQIELIREANEALEGIELLAGSEVNIMPDGSLDYADELLERLDWVIASVHTSFRMEEREMTDRIVAAIEHPWVDALGHPMGRKIEARRPYPLDVGRVIEAAARTGTMLEINANPDRRDLPDVYARAAAQAGVRIVINSDAHRVRTFERVRRYGIATARRGWLTKADVANTLPFARFMKLRKRARR